jgi:hypothetical protein
MLAALEHIRANLNPALVKKHMFMLSRVLADSEIANAFLQAAGMRMFIFFFSALLRVEKSLHIYTNAHSLIHHPSASTSGLHVILNALSVVNGNTLAYSLTALQTLAAHEAAVELMVDDANFAPLVLSSLQGVCKDPSAITATKAALSLCREVSSQSLKGLSNLLAVQQPSLLALTQLCLGDKSPLDVKASAVHLLNVISQASSSKIADPSVLGMFQGRWAGACVFFCFPLLLPNAHTRVYNI